MATRKIYEAVLVLRDSFMSGAVGPTLHEPLSELDVLYFENVYHISLPEEYRLFLMLIGNGSTEMFRLGEMDNGFGYSFWHENDGFVGKLSRPFPYTDAWNDLAGYQECDPEKDQDQHWLSQCDEQQARFFECYQAEINGAIPIAHEGCAIRLWLVVAGTETGNIWYDDRANLNGLKPLQNSDGSRTRFLDWCKGWPNGI